MGKDNKPCHDGDVKDQKNPPSDNEDIQLISEQLQNIKISEKSRNNLSDIAELIKSDGCRNIIVLVGAGVSTSCGIPDFRSPGTGIYDNLVSLKLPYPEALFEIDYFVKRPEAFYQFAKQNLGCFRNAKPSKSHFFLKLLENKGKLRRVYTQNIDNLEVESGVSKELICQAHGSFRHAVCLKCKAETSLDDHYDVVMNSEIPRCKKCKGLVKPKIVFFGENLPKKFYSCIQEDVSKCDLLIIMGTSLTVQPVSSIVEMVKIGVPRLLINLKCTGIFKLLEGNDNLEFDGDLMDVRKTDVYYSSTCDEGCLELAKLVGWDEELERISGSDK